MMRILVLQELSYAENARAISDPNKLEPYAFRSNISMKSYKSIETAGCWYQTVDLLLVGFYQFRSEYGFLRPCCFEVPTCLGFLVGNLHAMRLEGCRRRKRHNEAHRRMGCPLQQSQGVNTCALRHTSMSNVSLM